MSKGRKTVSVDVVKDQVNLLCGLDSLNQDEKRGACRVLETVLSNTRTYKGYGQVQKEGQDPTVWDRTREWDRRYF